MLKDIKYNGLTAAPSDYESPDGDLAGLLNLVPEDGDIKPVLPPTTMYNVGEGYNVVYVHVTAKITHYICLNETDNTLCWFDEDAATDDSGVVTKVNLATLGTDDEVYQVCAIGNTLIALCKSGTHHYLWKPGDKGYLYLGTHLPELALSFGLRGTMERIESNIDDEGNEEYITELKNRVKGDQRWGYIADDENVSSVTSGVMAKVNKWIAEKGNNSGRFVMPFFVRYAYRLYDGSLVMHSSPVLMLCASGPNPQVVLSGFTGNSDNEYWKLKYNVVGFTHQLDYQVVMGSEGTNLREEIENWKDIIKSVDIFISKPVYTFDQSGKIQYIRNSSNEGDDTYAVCRFTGAGNYHYTDWYSKITFNEAYVNIDNYDEEQNKEKHSLGGPYWGSNRDAYLKQRVILPEKSMESLMDDISDNSAFYLLKQIDIEELSYTSRSVIDVEDDYLQSLVNREVLTDDYDSHDTITPKYAFAYNNRINYTDIKKTLYNSYNTAALLQHTYAYVKWGQKHGETSDHTSYQNKTESYSVYFSIKQDGSDIVVKGEDANLGYNSSLLWLYYPNANCDKAYVKRIRDGITTVYKVEMKTHDFLNGAYYNGDLKDLSHSGYNEPQESTLDERTYDIANKVYTSDVNNPFRFAATNITTVGTGRIIGLSTAAKALSQGQFGQYPLYCFTDDGVWAMEVSSSTGAFSARQPITRDVCINADSITQLDSAVLFATDRGLMVIQGSDTACITDAIWSREAFNPLLLPSGDNIVTNAGFTAEQVGYVRFAEYMTGCGIIYDYTHQRIIVYNKDYRYAYVYSLKDKAWGMITADVTRSINKYPDAYAMTSEHRLINYSDEDWSAGGINTILWTRPLKLDAPDALKTIDTIIQRGYYLTDDVSQILYGSRDLEHWHTVWSSTDRYLRGFRGTPYKYYRMCVYGMLAPRKSIYGATIQYTPRYTNQPR